MQSVTCADQAKECEAKATENRHQAKDKRQNIRQKTKGSRLAYWQSKKARGGKQGRLWKSAALLATAPGWAEVPSVSLPW